MKVYIKSARDTSENLASFRKALNNMKSYVNSSSGYEIVTKISKVQDDYFGNSAYFYITVSPDFQSVSFVDENNEDYFQHYFDDYGIHISIWDESYSGGVEIKVDDNDSTGNVPISDIQDWCNEIADDYLLRLQDVETILNGKSLESYYQDWYESEIEPNLQEAFPDCNFYARIGGKNNSEFSIVFSKSLNPDYDGRTLYQDLVQDPCSIENMQFLVDHGYPKKYNDDYVLRLSKKLISKGIDVNRNLVSQKRKEAREAKDNSIDMNDVRNQMYDKFEYYLDGEIPGFDPDLLTISNIKVNHKSGRTDFNADLTYDGDTVRVWMPFEYDGFGNLIPYEDKPGRDIPQSVIDDMYSPLEELIELYE